MAFPSTEEPGHYGRLIKACVHSDQYPVNILRSNLSMDILKEYLHYINRNDSILFDAARARLVFWDYWAGTYQYLETIVETTEHLEDCLDRRQVEPCCRHVFIESRNSRAALDCSVAMLKFLFTYLQVDPSFLDWLFTFGDHDEPVDACLAQFKAEEPLFAHPREPILQLGRSGREIRCSLLMRAVERAPEAGWPWSIRQAAAYHSFDIENGQTVWINVKGNHLLQKRIRKDASDVLLRVERGSATVEPCLRAAFTVWLVYFTWCEENLRWCVRDIEDNIRRIVIKAKILPILKEPHFSEHRDVGRSNSSPLSPRRLCGLLPKASTFSDRCGKGRLLMDPSRQKRDRQDFLSKSTLKTQMPHASRPSTARNTAINRELVLEMFDYQDLQDLNGIGEKMEELILVTRLKQGVLEDVIEFYLSLTDSEGLPDEFRQPFKMTVPPFIAQVKAVIRRLETRQLQLESLSKRLDGGKAMFENIQAYRSLQVSRILAEQGRDSARAMVEIGNQLAGETGSMHSITILTLVFLPGTFVATFLGCGILEWRDGDPSWYFRGSAFNLFVLIALPLTAVLLAGWLGLYLSGKSKAHQKKKRSIRPPNRNTL